MKYRDFGNSGLRVSELIFGAGAVGGILIDPDDDTKRAALRKALDGGVNWIDTAASYGQGRSEQNLGWLLKEIDETPYLSTKFSVDPEAGDIPGQIEQHMEESLTRLQRDSVDLFQLHDRVSTERGWFQGSLSVEDVLGAGGVADGLDRLREQGLTRLIGFTATGETPALHEVVRSRRFDSAQVYYNLLNPSAGRPVPAGWATHDYGNLIATCADNGVAVMNIRVLAAGVIATDVRHGREMPVGPGADVAADERRTAMVVEALGDEYGARAQFAVRYALCNPGVSGVLVGFAELEHIDLALGAVEMGPLPEEAMDRLDRLISTDFGRL